MRFAFHCRLFTLAVLSVLVFAVPALAAAAEGHGGGEEKAPGGLSFAGLRWDLGLYTLIVFGILIWVLSKFAWPHIREGLEKREKNIRLAIEEARQSAAAAKKELDQARQELAKAALEVRAMMEEARKEAEQLKASEREVGVKDAQSERERARRDTEALKDALLKEIYEQAVKLAAMMSEKALRRAVSADDHRRLLDESLAELKSAASKA